MSQPRRLTFEDSMELKLEVLIEIHASESSEQKRKELEREVYFLALALGYDGMVLGWKLDGIKT